ncbi:MAG: outer membrane protein assembly factor BamD [Pseudomonadota bacterium]
MFPRYLLLPTLLALVLLAGCGTLNRDDWSAERYYEEAREAMESERYQTALEYYQELESEYPYGRYAEQAQLDMAYVYYRTDQPQSAIDTAERFIEMHPRHPQVDYAYYLRGLAAYGQNRSFLNDLFNQSPDERDPDGARDAFRYFAELVREYPDSDYTGDAVQRMIHLRNSLGRYETHVAEYYLDREAWVAAANRAKYVVENYDRTPAVADALAVMGQAYVELGRTELARDALKVLRENHPDHQGIGDLEQALSDDD